MSIIIPIVLIILSFVLAYLFGWSEANYWYYKSHRKTADLTTYEHALWTVIRTLSYTPLFLILYYYFGYFSVLGIVGVVANFMFWHDGAYYYHRNKLDQTYPLGFKDFSKTSTAKITITYDLRLKFAIWGTILIVFMFSSKIV